MKVFALGSNGSGQLGLGHQDDVDVPTLVHFPTDRLPSRPHKIVAGGNHTILLMKDGSMFASGHNPDGRCGNGLAASNVFVSAELFLPAHRPDHHIALCSATWEATYLVDIDLKQIQPWPQQGILWAGTRQEGRLLTPGVQPDTVDHKFSPLRLTGVPNARIVDISSSMGHTVAVFSNGEAWGWGFGSKGQLGNDASRLQATPCRIQGFKFHAERVVCGKDFTLLAGNPSAGEFIILGSDKFSIQASAPPHIRDYADIAASWGSIYVLLNSGRLISWGRNDHGQLCPAELPEITAFAAGSEHVVALLKTGKAVAWGWGEHGNCGAHTEDGDVKGRWNELNLVGRIVNVGAGCATTFLWTVEDQTDNLAHAAM